jgi:diguanylate cyclase (GGDEF)-like protein
MTQLLEKVAQCRSLPSMPSIAVEVLELAQSDDVDLGAMAKVIERDPALTTKLLRTVNSSFYARSKSVSTLSQAVVILGLQSVKTLVLGFSLTGALVRGESKGFDHMLYWKRSIYSATAARVIAKKMKLVQAEEIFLAALLSDIGMLALAETLGDEYGKLCAQAKSHADLPALEKAQLGADHGEVGRWLCQQWKLPPVLSGPIGAHHDPSTETDPNVLSMTEAVSLGSRCGDVFVDAQAMNAITDARTRLAAQLDISVEEADNVLKEIGEQTNETARLFDINLGTTADYQAVVKRAMDALVDLSLRSQQRTEELTERNEELRIKATIDRLTGLANRGTFDEFLAAKLEAATKTGQPLSLIMLDVDKFKSVNDTHGHPIGDEVLRQVAAIIGASARTDDLAARYGGEEMAVILPNTTRAGAGAAAERLRAALAAKPISTEAGELAITGSFGVACYDGSCPLNTPSALIKAADLAVYTAKKSGRNNVKVFAPKASGNEAAAA